jgi:rare lipoprotein A
MLPNRSTSCKRTASLDNVFGSDWSYRYVTSADARTHNVLSTITSARSADGGGCHDIDCLPPQAAHGTGSAYNSIIPYHGRPAADGEIYDMEKLVAAHRVMPFNTWLRVTNLKNSKSVDVRVIDRGPFIDGRIIDLSKAAARQIDLLGPGVGPVRLEVISAPVNIRSNDQYALQVGAFSVYANAERARTDAVARFGSAEIKMRQGSSAQYRVVAGRWSTLSDAQTAAAQMERDGKTAFVVRLDETVAGTQAAPGTPPLP